MTYGTGKEDLMKTAEDRSVWRTIMRDCHKPASQADN